MSTRSFGQRIRRNEDPRLLTGEALFVDDVELPRMAHAAFVRSPFAHARLESVDASRARQMDGVIAVYTAEDLGELWAPGPLLVPPPPIEHCTFRHRCQVPLAKGKVHHAGELSRGRGSRQTFGQEPPKAKRRSSLSGSETLIARWASKRADLRWSSSAFSRGMARPGVATAEAMEGGAWVEKE